MPNINLKDGRNRDARVRAESVGERATVRYVDAKGEQPRIKRVLRATAEHSHERLKAAAGSDDEALADMLVSGDGDVDLERIGMFLSGASRVYVNRGGEIVHHITETEVVRTPTGEEKERRPRKRPVPNADTEIPVNWTGRMIRKEEALRRFLFSSKLQIVHVNGLTYDFLYGMAKELHEAKSLMLLGAGKSGKEPLIFQRHSTPHRGFLEGRIDGDRYVLLLHLSKMELKRPAEVEPVAVAAVAAQAAAGQLSVGSLEPVSPPLQVPVRQPGPTPLPIAAEASLAAPPANSDAAPPANSDAAPPANSDAAPPASSDAAPPAMRGRKPTAREVLTVTATTQPAGATTASPKPEIAGAVEAAKATRARRTAAKVEAKLAPADSSGVSVSPPTETPAARPRGRRAAKARPDSTTRG